MILPIHKVRDRLEDLRLQGIEKGLDWLIDQIGQWEVELDLDEKEYFETLEKHMAS